MRKLGDLLEGRLPQSNLFDREAPQALHFRCSTADPPPAHLAMRSALRIVCFRPLPAGEQEGATHGAQSLDPSRRQSRSPHGRR